MLTEIWHITMPMSSFAAGQGLEPQLLGPEPSVLPLDDPASSTTISKNHTERNASILPEIQSNFQFVSYNTKISYRRFQRVRLVVYIL